MRIDNGKTKAKARASLAGICMALAFASCSNLQDSLSSEQLEEQGDGIGKLSSKTSVYYYNGSESDDVSGDEAHLSLNLSQIADATGAGVKYELSYTMDGIEYASSGTGKGTLSNSKSKYYVDLSPAINLLDGTKSPAYSDISYTVTVSGLKNASGNDYDGRAIPSFSQLVKFAPLYNSEIATFSTKSAPAGTEFEIPLNGEITAVDSTVTVTATDGEIPETTFTASVSEDGGAIVLTSSAPLTDADFTADFAFTGIKPVGGKESYDYKPSLSFSALEKSTVTKEIQDIGGSAVDVLTADELAQYGAVKKISAVATLDFTDVSGDWWAGFQSEEGDNGNWNDLSWSEGSGNTGVYTCDLSQALISAATAEGGKLQIKSNAVSGTVVLTITAVPKD